MKTSHFLIGAAALVALPSVALLAQPGLGKPAMTRADVEARVKDRFAMADANKDGVVEKPEAEGAREKARAERNDAHFKAMDSNGDGVISRAEFDAAHARPDDKDGAGAHRGKHDGAHHRRGGRAGERHGRMGGGGGLMFARADANQDGRLTLAEALTPALARFDAADANKDGTLSAEERKAARETMRGKGRERRS